jgi:ATP-dependent RNA helicase RhlE
VRQQGHSAAELHADRTLSQRKAALEGFKTGTYRVLVATDIAARGIDVKDISLVLNYDVPENPEDYVHRIGRTGRAGASGLAITLASPEQHRDIRDIEKLMGSTIRLSPDSRMSLPRVAAHVPAKPKQGQGPRKSFQHPKQGVNNHRGNSNSAGHAKQPQSGAPQRHGPRPPSAGPTDGRRQRLFRAN